MQIVRKYRIPALSCALAVLLCELIARPFADMGICDDGPYILMAQNLARTGHVVYNGWGAPMLSWQLYLGAALIKLFGFSFTTVRCSTLLVAIVMAFVLQRTLVRAGISEGNATIGTLTLVLSPLYLMLSVTYMSDIFGLFAIVLCLYTCLRALQSSSDRSAILWLCFAVVTNALVGTSRQIAWLGILVMVPCALWLLRSRRRVFLTGAAANLAGVLFILACMRWLKHQPYSIPEQLFPSAFSVSRSFLELLHTFLDVPFLLLPVMVLFIPEIRKSRPRVLIALLLGYLLVGVHPHHPHDVFLLEPTQGNWVTVYGLFSPLTHGTPPIFLHPGVQVLLTIASFGGLAGLIASLVRTRRTQLTVGSSSGTTWKQIYVLLAPFTVAYTLLLVPRSSEEFGVLDRYALALLVVALLCMVRYYQDRIRPQLPFAAFILIAIMAAYGTVATHNTFALYRARVALAAEIQSTGVPDTSVDNGWEYNFDVELRHASHINFPTIVVPPGTYVPTPPPSLPADCQMWWYDYTPHIRPLYGASFDPNACYGPAPFAPVHYSRWPGLAPGTLYLVRYTDPSAH
jgi:Dolichyl-phosphate-mannose-protein mannosyltransferase